MLEDVKCPTSATSHHLVKALCSMPKLTELTLKGGAFQGEFYTALNANASTLQVCMCICTLYPCHDESMYKCGSGDELRRYHI